MFSWQDIPRSQHSGLPFRLLSDGLSQDAIHAEETSAVGQVVFILFLLGFYASWHGQSKSD
jgi:hypothetical protein